MKISTDYRRTLLTALIILAVMASCALLIRLQVVQDTIRDGLVLPLYYIAWLAGLLIRSVDQVVLWSIALIGLAMLLIYGIAAARPFQNPYDEPRHREENLLPPAYGRVKFWKNRIDSLRSQGFDSDYAIHEFRQLTQDVVEISGENPDKAIANLPGDLVIFLEQPRSSGLEPLEQPSRPWWQRWLPKKALNLKPVSSAVEYNREDPLAELTAFLEEKLEINHVDHD